MRKTVRTSFAVLLALLVLLSALPLGAISVSAQEENPYAATRMNIFDESGNDITDNSIIYIDNSSGAGGSIQKIITVKISNDKDQLVDKIVGTVEAGQENIKVETIGRTDSSMTYRIYAEYVDQYDNVIHMQPGTTTVSFTTESGEVFRPLTVVVYDPATDAQVYCDEALVEFSKGMAVPDRFKNYQELKDFYAVYGSLPYKGGLMTVTNHQYRFRTEFTSFAGNCTDTVEYVLYDGEYDGTQVNKKPGTSKAEISKDGVLTPKSNGIVTIEIKPQNTETSNRSYSYVNIKPSFSLDEYDIPDNEVFSYNHYYLPKYLEIVIVKENPAKAMKIENAPSAMQAGEKYQLNLSMTPTYQGEDYRSGATDYVTWESSNENIAKVDKKGLVSAVAKGEVTITARGENDDVYTSCKIRVLTKATSITISPRPVSTRIGVAVEINAKMSPDTADEEIIWSVEDPSIATVESTSTAFTNTQKAVVTGVKEGATIIIAKARNSGVESRINVQVTPRNASDSLEITYQNGENIENIIDDSTVDLYTQKSIKIDAKLTDQSGSTSDDIVVWDVQGNDDDFVKFEKTNQDITINGVSVGTVTIKVSSQANPSLTKSFKVRVLKSCDYVTLKEANKNTEVYDKALTKGSSVNLVPDLRIRGNYPYQHNDIVVEWKSSRTDIAEVDNNGCVTGKAIGKSIITAVTASGKQAQCTITVFTTSSITMTGVTKPTDGASLPYAVISVDSDGKGSITLGAEVIDDRNEVVYNSDCFWESADPTIAKVDNNGLVEAVNIGQTIITVKSGSKSESCILYVSSDLNNTVIDALANMVYDPNVTEYKPPVVVKYKDKVLTEGENYTVEYIDNTKVGGATVKVTGKGKFSGVSYAYFSINPKDLSSGDIEISTIEDQQCTASEIKPAVVLKYSGVELVPGEDYDIYYSNNVYPGEAQISINGKNNYTGYKSINFNIFCNHEDTLVLDSHLNEPTCSMEGADRYVCSVCGQYVDQSVPKTAHTYEKTVHKPTYVSQGYTEYVCTYCGYSYIGNKKPVLERVSISNAKVKLSKTSYAYTGKAIKPGVTVSTTKTLKKGTDYKVSYKNNTKTGTATVVVTGINGYKGSITKTFKIYPKKATMSSVKSTKTKKITAKWKKDSMATGYELQYSTKSNFKSGNKTVKISKNSTVSKIVSTKKGKNYYFRVRAYKTISGTKVYGAWSAIKKCKSK